MQAPPAPYYYRSFPCIVRHVRDRHSSLFSQEEQGLLDRLLSLDGRPSLFLWLRIVLRKPGPIQRSTLSYAEIDCTEQALFECFQRGLLEQPTLCYADLFDCFTIQDLQQLAQRIGLVLRTQDKSGIIAELLGHLEHPGPRQCTLTVRGSATRPTCFAREIEALRARLVQVPVLLRARVEFAVQLFQLPTAYDPAPISSAILLDVRSTRFPAYALAPAGLTSLFATRDHAIAYFTALAVEDECEAAFSSIQASPDVQAQLEAQADHLTMAFTALLDPALLVPLDLTRDVSIHIPVAYADYSASKSSFVARYSPTWIWHRLLARFVHFFETRGAYDRAVKLLLVLLGQVQVRNGHRGCLWERLIIDMNKEKHLHDGASRALELALSDPLVTAGPRHGLERRAGLVADPPCLLHVFLTRLLRPGKRSHKSVFMSHDGDRASVEALALERYAEHGWRGLHVEGAIFSTLFGRLFWDLLFAEVPGVFVTPYQTAPLDLMSTHFARSRAALITARLAEIVDGHARSVLHRHYTAHVGEACIGVAWDQFDMETLSEIVTCLPPAALAGIMKIMAEDYKGACRGFPDLLLWNPDGRAVHVQDDQVQDMGRSVGPDPRRVLLVEVKGQHDRLSDHQRHWMCLLTSLGIEVVLCKIQFGQ